MTAPNTLPHPPNRLPFLGDVKLADIREPSLRLTRIAKSMGPIFEQRVFSKRVVIVAGTELVNEVNDDAHWEKHIGHTLRKLRPLLGDGLFTASNSNPNWGKAHRILMPGFNKEAMVNYHDSIKVSAWDLLEHWTEQSAKDKWVDVAADTNRLTLEIITRAGFSHSFNAIRGQFPSSFIEAFIRELAFANRKTDTLPAFEKHFLKKRRAQHEEDLRHAQQVVDRIVEERRAGDGRASDILDIMLRATDPETGESLDNANIRYQILTFLIAGSETSANVIAFALHYLSIHPQIAEQARSEIDQRWPDRQFPDIRYEEVAKLRQIRRIAEETLRLWPVVPGYFRQAKHDTAIGNGKYQFKKRDWVFVLLQAAQRDPRHWGTDADEFNPDRLSNPRKDSQRVYKPFGTGERACIGRQFAFHEIVLALAAILHQFELYPDPNYTLNVSEKATLKPAGLRLRLQPRS